MVACFSPLHILFIHSLLISFFLMEITTHTLLNHKKFKMVFGICLPQGCSHQLITQYLAVSSENMYIKVTIYEQSRLYLYTRLLFLC